MGILDDAIRQHLDLKRRQGADAIELQRLEDEAFGPPARPGDPDFPDDDGAEAPDELGPSAEEPGTALAEPEVAPAEPEGPPGLFDAESEHEPFAEAAPEAPVVDEPAVEPAEEFDLDEIDLELDAAPEVVDEAAPEPAPLPEPEPVPEPEPEPEEPEAVEPAPEPEAVEPPIESLDTVEHRIEEAEPPEVEAAPEPPAPVPEPEEQPPAGEEEGEGEDVLEETPEFLRDQPEDDELWFEQGEPKDFDF